MKSCDLLNDFSSWGFVNIGWHFKKKESAYFLRFKNCATFSNLSRRQTLESLEDRKEQFWWWKCFSLNTEVFVLFVLNNIVTNISSECTHFVRKIRYIMTQIFSSKWDFRFFSCISVFFHKYKKLLYFDVSYNKNYGFAKCPISKHSIFKIGVTVSFALQVGHSYFWLAPAT